MTAVEGLLLWGAADEHRVALVLCGSAYGLIVVFCRVVVRVATEIGLHCAALREHCVTSLV